MKERYNVKWKSYCYCNIPEGAWKHRFSLIFVIIILNLLIGPAQAAVINVCQNGCNYTSIQAAIEDASPYDEIYVYSGTYYENVNVTKQLTLRGMDTGGGQPVVDAGGNRSAITLLTDGITLERFTVTNSGKFRGDAGIKVFSNNNIITWNNINNNGEGIHLESSSNNVITGNNVTSNEEGIYLYLSENNLISNNTASNNDWEGIFLWSSGNNTLSGNNASGNNAGIIFWDSCNNSLQNNTADNNIYGIYLTNSENNTLKNNRMSDNIYNFGVPGWDVVALDYEHFSKDTSMKSQKSGNSYNSGIIGHEGLALENDIDTSNFVDGKPIYYLVGTSDIVINSTSNAGIVYCLNCDNVTVRDLTLINNYAGVFFYHTRNSSILNNYLGNNNGYGIILYSSNNNNISGNNASSNNEAGIYLTSSSNNTIYHNNFINNSKNAFDDSSNNLWDSGYPTGGNYWSDYTGIDASGDGIGDAPYIISGGAGAQDRYPLMDPWTHYGNGEPAPSGANLIVDDSGGADYTRIQEAIDAANGGDTIYVRNGTYYEHLLIWKDNLTLLGENKETTIIDGGGIGGIIRLFAANNNSIQEFTIQNGKKIKSGFPPAIGYTREFLKENYSLTLFELDEDGEEAWIELSKDGEEIHTQVVHIGDMFEYRMDYNDYVDQNNTLILSFKLNKTFLGEFYNFIEVCDIYQYSEKDLSVIVQNESALLTLGKSGEFIFTDGGLVWELEENYTLNVIDIQTTSHPHKAMLLLTKEGEPVDYAIINVSENYTYYKDGNLILSAHLEAVFGGEGGVSLAKLSHVNQYSEKNTADLLLSDAVHLYSVGTREVEWPLEQNYSLSAMDIHSTDTPHQVWFRLKKDGIPVEDQFVQSGDDVIFYKDSIKILNLTVDDIFNGKYADIVLVSNIYQYSETDETDILTQCETHQFIFGYPKGKDWQLYENYSLAFVDVDSKTDSTPQVWVRMKKNGMPVDDQVLTQNEVYRYYNNSMLLFNASIDTIFNGRYLDLLKLTNASQYSEIDGTQLRVNANHLYSDDTEFFENQNEKLVLYENYVIVPVDIDIEGMKVWLRIYKNNTMVDEIILEEDQNYSYCSAGREIISTKLDTVFLGMRTHLIKLIDIYQYSEVNGALLMYKDYVLLRLKHFPSGNDAGIYLDTSSSNIISNNDIKNIGHGILLVYSSKNTLMDNNVSNNDYGLYLKNDSNLNIIKNNNAYSNSNGISLLSSNNNTITSNNFCNNNKTGLYLFSSSNNTIYHNNFVNNSKNAFDDSSNNLWDSGYPTGGNYWSDYTGIDASGDGIGDAPYIISGTGAKDNYPFVSMNGWTFPRALYFNQSVNTTSNNITKIDALEKVNTTLEFVTINDVTGASISMTMSNEIMPQLNQSFGIGALGKYISINVSEDLKNNLKWVMIKVYYTQAELDASGLDESSLVLRYYNGTSGVWEAIIPSGVSPADIGDYSGYVWANVSHFSYYGVGGKLKEDKDNSGNSGGGSGGGGGPSGEDFKNILISETEREYVNKGSKVSYSFDSEGNIVRYINFTGLTGSGRIAAKVEILKNTSTMVELAPPDIVYKNLNIWVGNLGWATSRNIANPTISFKVERSWITENDIDESTIRMNRYSGGKWNPLVTTRTGDDSDYLYFEAQTPGFSPFAVTGKKAAVLPGGAGIIAEPAAVTEETSFQTPAEEKRGIPGFSLFAGISILLIAVQLLRKKK